MLHDTPAASVKTKPSPGGWVTAEEIRQQWSSPDGSMNMGRFASPPLLSSPTSAVAALPASLSDGSHRARAEEEPSHPRLRLGDAEDDDAPILPKRLLGKSVLEAPTMAIEVPRPISEPLRGKSAPVAKALLLRSARQARWRSQIPFLYESCAIHRRGTSLKHLNFSSACTSLSEGPSLSRLFAAEPDALVLLVARIDVDVVDEAAREGASAAKRQRLGVNSLLSDGPTSAEDNLATCLKKLQSMNHGYSSVSVRTTHRMPHPGQVCRLAESPHKQLLLASQAHSAEAASPIIRIFDATRWEGLFERGSCRPDRVLQNTKLSEGPSSLAETQRAEGLLWHPRQAVQLLSATQGGVRIWDVEKCMAAADFYVGEQGIGPTTEVALWQSNSELSSLVCGLSRGAIHLWDERCDGRHPTFALSGSGRYKSLGLAANTSLPMAVGLEDGGIELWDLRKRQVLETLRPSFPTGPVEKLVWCSMLERDLLASTETGHVLHWRTDQTSPGQSSLAFVHSGHCGEAVGGLAASRGTSGWFVSCAEPRSSQTCDVKKDDPNSFCEVHFWKPASSFLKEPGEAA
mmetsp:Transcript_72717/g.151822  ORF Transcript_72717/g.151822 Transcript_72717/m.151822 type:complete len:574 (-) Transcript_72717:27-1748(-)|eukprot:CAMPEP_0206487024 /NCGR_PEP_ID=MMETSP0324_2-20121206/41366_1 /ASSEMBLY_ACC=CAM_ASM_000836 /TAXON_ID=2866 /ORGANISM="Crypthecodinium cohnii, Strain Seligo" /LENGTH=573 /DNA_ID=CAMNT_0053965369 /DNA_START=34 /DNA_END=1755 /DNA_ORIENTATION=+